MLNCKEKQLLIP